MTQAKTDYFLQVGEEGRYRLDLLQALHGKYTAEFCQTTITEPVSSILDVGCGVGNVSHWFAGKYAKAQVYGLDNSAAQLAIADHQCPSNLHFINQNIEQCDELPQKYDLIYLRYTLVHLQNPLSVLQLLANHLTASGKIIIEEPTMSTAFCYPENKAYDQSRLLLKRLFELKGLDHEIGKRLQEMVLKIGLNIVFRKLAQPLLETPDEKRLLSLLVEESAEAYCAYNLVNELELQEVIKELKKISACKKSFIAFPRTTQICVEPKH